MLTNFAQCPDIFALGRGDMSADANVKSRINFQGKKNVGRWVEGQKEKERHFASTLIVMYNLT